MIPTIPTIPVFKYERKIEPKNKLGEFYDDEVYVKLKDNADLSYFKDIKYIDYRVGCAICEKGDASDFRINILDIAKNDYFLLNELDIVLDKWHLKRDWSMPLYYQTNDPATIKLVFEYFKKFNDLNDEYHGHNPQYSLIDTCQSAGGITSIFRSNKHYDQYINKVYYAHICDNCFKWLIYQDKELSKKFVAINSLKIFWADTVIDYLEDLIEFKDPEDKKIFIIADDNSQSSIFGCV